MSYIKGEAYIGRGWFDTDAQLTKVIMLPHSCDEWVVGGVADAKQLIADMEVLISQLEKLPAKAPSEEPTL